MGITQGRWTYSGAPCYATSSPNADEIAVNEAHRNANGQTFSLTTGMEFEDAYAFPGQVHGCKCVTNPVIPGF